MLGKGRRHRHEKKSTVNEGASSVTWKTLEQFARVQIQEQELGKLLPKLCLHGLAEGDFELALRGLLGDSAPLSSERRSPSSGAVLPALRLAPTSSTARSQ
jgi:hypothetical protein